MLNHSAPRSVLNRVFCLTWILLVSNSIGFASASAASLSEEDLVESIQSYFALADVTHESLSDLRFDHVSVLDRVADGPQETADWIRENVRCLAYEGLLKNPDSVWAALQGNSLERALLLQSVLNDRGFQTRIAYSNIPASEKESYLANMKSAGVKRSELWNQSPLLEDERWKSELESIAGPAAMESIESRADQIEAVNVELDTEAGDLAEKLISLAGLSEAVSKDSNVGGISTHYWIQYMDEGSWTDCCPLYGDDLPTVFAGNVAGSWSSPAEIPDALKHSVEFDVVVTQLKSGVERERTALSQSWPMFDVGNKQLTFSLSRVHSMEEGLAVELLMNDPEGYQIARLESIASETHWIPSLYLEDSEDPIADQQFDHRGDLSRAGQTPRNPGSAIVGGGGFGALTGGSRPKPGILSGVDLVIRITTPSGKVRTVKRTVYDMVSNGGSASQISESEKRRRAFCLTQTREFLLQSGRVDTNWADYKSTGAVSSASLSIKYLLRSSADLDPQKIGKAIDRVLPRVKPLETALHTLASFRGNTGSYLSSVNVVGTTRQELDSKTPGELVAVDWIANSLNILDGNEQKSNLVKLGIKDTLLEHRFVENGYLIPQSSIPGLVNAEKGSAKWGVLKNPSELNDSAIDERYSEGVLSDLDEGYLVVLPSNEMGENWWRIHPDSGETLGMSYSEFGLGGQAALEYEEVKAWLKTYALNIIGFVECLTDLEQGDDIGGLKCAGCFLGSVFAGHLAIAKLQGKAGTMTAYFGASVNFFCE